MQDYTVFDAIDEHYDNLSKNHKKIADYIKTHYDKAVFMTAARLGEHLGISESTVVRFASCIGFDGYPRFQKNLENCIQNKLNNVQRIDAKYGENTNEEIIRAVLQGDMEKIQHTMNHVDSESFSMAVDAIWEAKHVYIMGLRGSEPLAGFLQFYLNMIRGDVICVNSSSPTETFEQMIRISEEDCFIGISFPRYSMRTLKAMEFANSRNVKVIAVTDTEHSPMNLYASCKLLAKSDMVSIVDSLVAPLSLINALVVALCMKSPETVNDNLKLLEDAWNNYQVDSSDEINLIDGDPMLQYSLKDK